MAKSRIPSFIAPGLVGAVVAVAAALLLTGGADGHRAERHENAFERVMRTNVLRCGYYMFKPMTWRDKDGRMQGMAVAFADALEQRSGVKVEWTEEVTFGNMFEGLKTGRYDAICTPTWPDGHTARAAVFTKPWFYAGIVPIVRADETRFKNNGDFDSPGVTVVVQDGNQLQALVGALFPKAKEFSLAAAADGSEMEQALVTHKADVMFGDVNRFLQFDANNPGKLKILNLPPVQLNPFKLATAKGEEQLAGFLSENIDVMQNDGTMAQIIRKYEPVPGAFLPLAKPYEGAK